jgi:hypothetical protein
MVILGIMVLVSCLVTMLETIRVQLVADPLTLLIIRV